MVITRIYMALCTPFYMEIGRCYCLEVTFSGWFAYYYLLSLPLSSQEGDFGADRWWPERDNDLCLGLVSPSPSLPFSPPPSLSLYYYLPSSLPTPPHIIIPQWRQVVDNDIAHAVTTVTVVTIFAFAFGRPAWHLLLLPA